MNWIAVSQPIHEDMAVYRNDPQKRPVIETSRELAVHGMHESILHLRCTPAPISIIPCMRFREVKVRAITGYSRPNSTPWWSM